jgi:predicted O-linked N-acetylglucosamine transferase (SPINDLY family)
MSSRLANSSGVSAAQPGAPQSSAAQSSAAQPSAAQPGAPQPGAPQPSGSAAGAPRESTSPDVDSLMSSAERAARERDPARAIDLYSRVTLLLPTYAVPHYKLGNVLKDCGQLEAALASYDRAVELDPAYANAFCNRGVVLERLNRVDAALASYDRAVALNPADAFAHFNRGGLLRRLGRSKEALASYDQAIEMSPRFAAAHNYRGVLLHDLQQVEAARASYDKAIEADPGHAEAYYNRGVLLQSMKQSDAAMADYDKAIELIPHFAEAHCNRGVLLHARQRLDEALESYDKAIELEANYSEALLNRGILLLEMGQPDAALESLDRAIELTPNSADAHYNRGEALYQLMQPVGAIASYYRALELRPNFTSALGKRRYAMMAMCDWRDLDSDIERITAGILSDVPVSAPLPISALLDDPSLQHRAAQIWARTECPPDGALGVIPRRPAGAKIRIGYFSADFRCHAVGQVSAHFLENHDRSRFEITAFAFGPEASDPVRKRLERAFDRFIDVRRCSDLEVAALARELGIDIAIDLGGFTEYCRTKIFALRAAPIQINFLGYPGTMGADYMDYLIADATVIPESNRRHCSEKVIYLPNSFLPYDSTRKIANVAFPRKRFGLPAKGFVFCCFNNSQKITPSTFDSWMRILRRVTDSVLWLSQSTPTAVSNLRHEASRRGVSADRLIFADRLASSAEHLARVRQGGLFLDTLPYNAHATALDALWAGLPVLTRPGEGFAARVAASLLRSVNLPELIAADAQQYEDMAVELAGNPERLAGIRRRLAENRLTAPLFDTRKFARHLESAYTRIWARYQAQLPPEHVHVAELAS